MYFEFKIHKNNFALNVFGYDSSGKEKTGPIALEVLESEDKVKNPNGLTRRAQVINRGSIRDFMGIGAATGPIDPTKITRDMYFKASVEQDPRHPGKKLMFFFFSDTLAKLKAAAAGDGSTNPSPPANACVGNCDNADYK